MAWIHGWGPVELLIPSSELGNKSRGGWHGRKGTESCGELGLAA